MGNSFAVPQVMIEIYPFEGGPYYISGPQLISCTVEKNIRADRGQFSILLPPGGPYGPENNLGNPSWTQVITPMSLCIIGMARGTYRQVVMVGIVQATTETQTWLDSQQGVRRTITISGSDFSQFFIQANWYSLTFLGATAAAGLTGGGIPSEVALPAILGAGLLQGTPDQIGSQWYNQIMAGTNGIMSQTIFAYGPTRSVTFTDAMAQTFQPYPNVIIPGGDFFMCAEGNWMTKFREIFPFPFFEFFVTTVPDNPVGTSDQTAYSGLNGGYPFEMTQWPGTSAVPGVIARPNPLPVVSTTVNGRTISFTGIDVSAWNLLPFFTPDFSFLDSQISFSADQVRNWYVINPTYFRTMIGGGNTEINPVIMTQTGAYDPASIHRYGFQPEIMDTHLWADPTGQWSQNMPPQDLFSGWAQMTAQLFSFYEPTPLMARGQCMLILRPDIVPGCVFEYTPFKAGETWDFYIEGIRHSFVFGGRCTTTLELSRGLPSSVYDSSSTDDVLYNAHVGNAMRQNGNYVVGLPAGGGAGLQPIDISTAMGAKSVMTQIAGVYVTPQTQ